MDTVINYDFTNQKLRYFGSSTSFNDSSKPTSHFEELNLYNEVRIEADDVYNAYSHVAHHDICGVLYEAMGLAGVHTFNWLFASRRFPVDHKIIVAPYRQFTIQCSVHTHCLKTCNAMCTVQ